MKTSSNSENPGKLEKILLFGASQHCRNTIDVIEREGKYVVGGILDDKLEKGGLFAGYPVLGKISDLHEISASHRIGQGIIVIGDNHQRMKVAERILQMAPDFHFVSAVHPSVIIGKNATIGGGSVVMPGVIINNDTHVGIHCYLSTKSSIDHDSSLGAFSSFGPGVTTGGNVHIGFCTAIGLGASIIHGMRIGDHTVIGAGSVVVRNVGDHVVAYGNPARVVRERKEGEKYL